METSKEKKNQIKDFVEDYTEIMKILGKDMQSVENDWNNNGRHIKKFSLLKETPTPILTDHTNPIPF